MTRMWTPPSKEEQINHGKHCGASTFLYRKIIRKNSSSLKLLAIMRVTSMIFVMEDSTRTIRDSNILEAVVEDLSDDVRFESNNNNACNDKKKDKISSLSTTATAAQKKRRSPTDILEKHLKEREQRRNDNDLLKVQKAVLVQLKSYCMGMKQLLSLKKYKESCTDDEEQQQLIQRMKSAVGVAVSQMETHIHAGTIWCPISGPDVMVQRTPKSSNQGRRSSTSTVNSSASGACRKLMPNSSEKEVELDLESSSVGDAEDDGCVSPKKSFCCAGEYCWKEDYPLEVP